MLLKFMKQTSTITGVTFKKYLVLFLTILSFTFSQTVLGHSVDSYSGTCASGPQYKVTAVVSNVNNSSNYRWQWKNASNAWVCFVNGANTINGISYNVSGAVYNLTTNPGPIIFTNPGSGLQGLQIRMVISDGNGVNPCNLPNGNTWTSVNPFTINVTNTACAPCNGRVTSVYFNKLDNGADLPITNGATFTVAQLGSLYNLEAGTSGTVGSVKYTITGPTPSSNTENTTPYNSPSTGSGAWTGAVGTYTVNLKTYSSANATGTLCHDTTITFNITTANCNCPGANIVLNPSFESGTTNWSSSGGTLTAGNGAVACGSFSGDLNNTSASSKAWQTIGTDLAIGTVVNVSVYAGTHDNTFNNWVAVEFLNASNVVLGTSVYVQVDKVLANAPAGPQLYNFTATVPTGTKYTRVAFGGNGSYTKTDRWCVYTTPPVTGSIGDRVWLDANANGIQDATETGGISGVTVQLRNSVNTVIATQTTNASGNYLFTGLSAGTYTVVFPLTVTVGVLTTANVGSNDDIDSDPSTTTGITGNITLAANQNITNVDAGYRPTNLKLGNRVWYDTNNNGINDAAENGIRNVTVKLYKDDNNDNVADGASVATLLTDVDGYYTFSNLSPGNYIVGAVIPNGYMSSSINGGDPDNNTDLDDNGQVASGNEVRGLAITLTSGGEPTSGSTNNTYDFGMLPDCACTNSTANKLVNASFENGTTGWNWSSANGSFTTGTGYVACGAKNGFNDQNSGTARVWQDVAVSAGATVYFSAFAGTHAPGIACSPKLSVIFLNASNTAISQLDVTVTRVVGDYHDQLEQYSLTGVAPAGTVKVRVQSSITCNTMKLDAFCLTVSATGSIGDFVWQDINRNGLQDNNEPGIGGVTVTLGGAATATTTTAADGSYHFNNLAAGTYTVTFATPTAPGNPFVATASNAGSNDAIDSDPVGGVVSNIVLAAGESKNTVDAGFYRQINLSGNVWNDANGLTDLQINKTGTQALPNSLNIYLVDVATNQIIQAESILPDGTYSFLDVEINTSYKIVLSTVVAFPGQTSPMPFLPSGWQRVGENLGAGPLSGNDGVPNGLLFIDTETSDIIDANFGIRVSGGEIIVG